jgi:hypothetical protein
MKKIIRLTESDLTRIVKRVINEEDDKKKEEPKIEAPKPEKEKETKISIEDELENLNCTYDGDLARDLDEYIEDNFFDEDITNLKRKIVKLIKTCQD